MNRPSELLLASKSYLQRGLSMVPFQLVSKGNKFSKLPCASLLEKGKLNTYKERHPSESELENWFSNSDRLIGVVTGPISNGFLALDFEAKNSDGQPIDCLFDSWRQKLEEANPALSNKLVIAGSFTAGRHTYGIYPGLEKIGWLAKSEDGSVLIEARSAGEICCVPPSKGYQFLRGDMKVLPILDDSEVEDLISVARSFNQYKTNIITAQDTQQIRAGDWYNQQDLWQPMIINRGWKTNKRSTMTGISLWARPGKDFGHSATYSDQNNRGSVKAGIFYVFTPNAHPLEANKGYDKFALYTYLEHGGNFSAAAKAVYTMMPTKLRPTSKSANNQTEVNLEKLEALWWEELEKKEIPPLEFLVEDLIHTGLSLLAGPPKAGKSILAANICLDVASKGIGVLCCALEDSERRIQHRIKLMLSGKKKPTEKILAFITRMQPLPEGLLQLENYLEEHPKTKLVVIDLLAKVKPMKQSGSDIYLNDYNILAPLQEFAQEKNMAVIVVHHVRKSTGRGDVFEEISGTNAISGVADTLLVLQKTSQEYVSNLHVTGRDVEEQEIELELEAETLTWNYAGAKQKALSPERQEIYRILEQVDEPLQAKELIRRLGRDTNGNGVYKLLSKMTRDRQIEKTAYGKYQVPDKSGQIGQTLPKPSLDKDKNESINNQTLEQAVRVPDSAQSDSDQSDQSTEVLSDTGQTFDLPETSHRLKKEDNEPTLTSLNQELFNELPNQLQQELLACQQKYPGYWEKLWSDIKRVLNSGLDPQALYTLTEALLERNLMPNTAYVDFQLILNEHQIPIDLQRPIPTQMKKSDQR